MISRRLRDGELRAAPATGGRGRFGAERRSDAAVSESRSAEVIDLRSDGSSAFAAERARRRGSDRPEEFTSPAPSFVRFAALLATVSSLCRLGALGLGDAAVDAGGRRRAGEALRRKGSWRALQRYGTRDMDTTMRPTGCVDRRQPYPSMCPFLSFR